MTADAYVPDEDQVRAWCREGTGGYPDVMDEWIDRFLARVRRDAARSGYYRGYYQGYSDRGLERDYNHAYPEETP